ncbi:MAG TPA: hypothetical protein VI318_21130 [Baekduia sp.]
MQIAYVALIVLAWLGSGVVTLLKGRVAVFVAGLFTVGLVWLIGACLPARPGSQWERARGRSRTRRSAPLPNQ